MTKTTVDLDEELLAEAADVLGTHGKKATISAALGDVVQRNRREAALAALSGMDFLADLADPLIQRRVWRASDEL